MLNLLVNACCQRLPEQRMLSTAAPFTLMNLTLLVSQYVRMYAT
jgi:hypothetical protein